MNKLLFCIPVLMFACSTAYSQDSPNMDYSQFLEFCRQDHYNKWESMTVSERLISNLCNSQNEGFGEKQWGWLNGDKFDWKAFTQNASEYYANEIPEFIDGGIKETLHIDSFVSGRDSFPPSMVAMISFDYEKFSQVRHYDEKFTICIDGKLVPQDGFIKCSDEYVKYDFTKEEPFAIPKFVKKTSLPEHTRQQMLDWCQNSPKYAKTDKQFWDVIPVRLVSNTDEFQSLRGIKDSFVINSNAGHDTCPPTMWVSGTFASENGKRHGFALEYDADQFRYQIGKVQCKQGFMPIVKTVGASVVCVTPDTARVLTERGWAVHISDKILVTGNDAQKICDILDLNCPFDQTFYGIKGDNGIIVEQQTDDEKYRFDIYPNEFCYSKNGWGIGICRTTYPTVIISSTKHDPRPNSIILEIGTNNTTYWKNESDIPIALISEDKRWSTGLLQPNEGKIIKFNETAFYKYHSLPPTAIDGRIAILSDQTKFLPIQEKLAIAREIITVDMGPPITAIGIGNADNVLDITIHEDELEKNPNAEEYYKKRYQNMIPFEVPIRIEFGHMEPE